MKTKIPKIIIISILTIGMLLVFLGTSFLSIIKNDIDNIEKIEQRHPGNGHLYSTSDKKLINEFIKAMNSPKYFKSIKLNNSLGKTPIVFLNKNNDEVSRINYTSSYMEINGKSYIKIGDISEELESFYREFYSYKNIVNE